MASCEEPAAEARTGSGDLESAQTVRYPVPLPAAGSAGAHGGLGIIVLNSSRVYAFPRAYAALALLSLVGILIFLLLSLVSHLMLRKWHESALKREN